MADQGSAAEAPGVPAASRFSPEEEANLVAESNTHKTAANQLFSAGKYQSAMAKYDEAMSSCPNYLDYELAVLKSNVAACHIKLEEWKEAIQSATDALAGLDKLEGRAEDGEPDTSETKTETPVETAEEVDEEIISAGATKAAPAPPSESETAAERARRQRQEDILRIRTKALLRRARARSEAGGWSNLAGAQDDYKTLAGMTNLATGDRKTVQAQLRALPPRVKEAQEREMGEVWGKLKDLGNGLLKPFGLSTDNFQMVKDEKTGGYSMNFAQNAKH